MLQHSLTTTSKKMANEKVHAIVKSIVEVLKFNMDEGDYYHRRASILFLDHLAQKLD